MLDIISNVETLTQSKNDKINKKAKVIVLFTTIISTICLLLMFFKLQDFNTIRHAILSIILAVISGVIATFLLILTLFKLKMLRFPDKGTFIHVSISMMLVISITLLYLVDVSLAPR